jgi:DNA-binding transcriptional regulator GbsR (MarR family)
MGQIYGTVLLSQEPLCLDDVVDHLDVSEGNGQLKLTNVGAFGDRSASLQQ